MNLDQQQEIIKEWGFRINTQILDSGKKRLVVVGFDYTENQFSLLEEWGWDVDRECQRVVLKTS